VQSFVKTDTVATGRTGEGDPGFGRDVFSELYLLGVVNFVGENTFYEKDDERDSRFKTLIQAAVAQDPEWVRGWVSWLRTDANMRSAPLVAGIEAARAMLALKLTGGRQIVDSVLRRGDEPCEALSYWISRYGRKIPKPIKRGFADAAQRLFTEFNWLKYDSAKDAVRFADVIELCHVQPIDATQARLFRLILDDRHGRGEVAPIELEMVVANRVLRQLAIRNPHLLTEPSSLKTAGMTWEDSLSLLGTIEADKATLEKLKAQVWQANVQNMGYMALLRNLRNISQYVDERTLIYAASRIRDEDQVAHSRQFPFRFLSAYKATAQYQHHWGPALERALQLSVKEVPILSGRTLILVDVSGSMSDPLSAKSEMTRCDVAGLFGAALAIRNAGNVDLVRYNDGSWVVPVARNGSVLQLAKQFQPGGGTATHRAVQQHFNGHDRVILITDEQSWGGDPASLVPATTKFYTWNLGGYRYTGTAGGSNRFVFGGLTDQSWRLIPLLEAGLSQRWPWEQGE
jgi:hypothetical protein